MKYKVKFTVKFKSKEKLEADEIKQWFTFVVGKELEETREAVLGSERVTDISIVKA